MINKFNFENIAELPAGATVKVIRDFQREFWELLFCEPNNKVAIGKMSKDFGKIAIVVRVDDMTEMRPANKKESAKFKSQQKAREADLTSIILRKSRPNKQ